jgi:tripartite-type tricarboxylate transporter receptor subunit TctC
MKSYRSIASHLLTALIFSCAAGLSVAQPFPAKAVRIVVPYAPGGSADSVARIIGDKMSQEWKQPVLVDNKPGAGSTIGSALVAGSPADGYVLLLHGVIAHVSSAFLFKGLTYDPVKSFAPVAQISVAPFVLVVNPSLKVQTVKDLIDLAKANPGQLTFGSSGTGGGTHLAMEMLADAAGIKLVHAPFKGTAPGVTALLGSHVSMVMGDVSVAPHVKSGALRALVVTTAQPSALMPGIPTVAQTGVPSFEAASVIGILAPAGTPREVVTRINATINRALKAEDARQKLFSLGSEPAPATPEEFGQTLAAESQRYGRIIQRVGVKAD